MGLTSATSIREICGDNDDDLAAVWPVMVQLRPHLDLQAFVELCKLQFDEGFRLVAAFEGEVCRAVAGFRIQHRGKNLYVDDLVSDADARSRGFGKALLDWMKDEARRHGCANLHLDSGVQRAEAHAFYFAQGLRINAYHFAVDL